MHRASAYFATMTANQHAPDFPGKYFAVDGHGLHFVSSANDRLAALMAVIGSAKVTIRIVMYMLRDDSIGQLVMDALLNACKRGVDVNLIIDNFGSADTPDDFFLPLSQAGGHFHRFSSRWNIGYFVRNHQKIVIADNAHVLIGGYNLTDHYFARAGAESWEDFGVVLSGPMAAQLTTYYDDLKDLTKDGGVRFLQLQSLIHRWGDGDGKLGWALGGPSNRISPWALALKRRLRGASSLYLASAYFSPSQSILRRIAAVARKGQSKLILAGKTDNGATIGAARSLYKYLLKRGADIYEYQPLPLHMKLLVIDDVSFVGSANFDVRSLFINLEIMLRIEDASVAEYLRAHIGAMAEFSEKQTLLMHRKRTGFFTRIKWAASYLLVNSIDYTIGRRIKFSLLRKVAAQKWGKKIK
jgi:cardiolipin synthase A/B